MRKLARDAPLAKLSRPKIHRAVPRERLFDRLDRSTERLVSWVVAPPGAGKTTLLASYLESRKLAGIWYQLDPDDAEPYRPCSVVLRRTTHLLPHSPSSFPKLLAGSGSMRPIRRPVPST